VTLVGNSLISSRVSTSSLKSWDENSVTFVTINVLSSNCFGHLTDNQVNRSILSDWIVGSSISSSEVRTP